MKVLPDSLLVFARKLYERQILCVPLNKGGRHINLSAMGLQSPHLNTLRKDLKEVVFGGTLAGLVQMPPERQHIEKWFDGYDGNIGIIGGYGDVVILDFDRSGAFDAFRQKWPTLTSSTPVEETPNGFHVYLRCSIPYATSSLYFSGRKIGHLKAWGGYVVSDPSILNDGTRYTWLKGQSPTEIELQKILRIDDLGFQQRSLARRLYDRFLGHDFFVPA